MPATASKHSQLKDIQKTRDTRGIAINRVGVSDLRYPITVLDRENKAQHTVGVFSLSVDLPHHFKGTHMSRFVEVLNECHGNLGVRSLPKMLGRLRRRLGAGRAHIEVVFPYFVKKTAPVSRAAARLGGEMNTHSAWRAAKRCPRPELPA